jgi:hypothetical protein
MYADKILRAMATGDRFVRVFRALPNGGGHMIHEGLLAGDGIETKLANAVRSLFGDYTQIRVETLTLDQALVAHAGAVYYAEQTGRI